MVLGGYAVIFKRLTGLVSGIAGGLGSFYVVYKLGWTSPIGFASGLVVVLSLALGFGFGTIVWALVGTRTGYLSWDEIELITRRSRHTDER